MFGPDGIKGREMTRAIKLASSSAELMLIEGSGDDGEGEGEGWG